MNGMDQKLPPAPTPTTLTYLTASMSDRNVSSKATVKNAFGYCIKLLIHISTAVSTVFVADQAMSHRANRVVKFVNDAGHVRIQFLQFGVLIECRIACGLVHEARLLVVEALSALDQRLAC